MTGTHLKHYTAVLKHIENIFVLNTIDNKERGDERKFRWVKFCCR